LLVYGFIYPPLGFLPHTWRRRHPDPDTQAGLSHFAPRRGDPDLPTPADAPPYPRALITPAQPRPFPLYLCLFSTLLWFGHPTTFPPPHTHLPPLLPFFTHCRTGPHGFCTALPLHTVHYTCCLHTLHYTLGHCCTCTHRSIPHTPHTGGAHMPTGAMPTGVEPPPRHSL